MQGGFVPPFFKGTSVKRNVKSGKPEKVKVKASKAQVSKTQVSKVQVSKALVSKIKSQPSKAKAKSSHSITKPAKSKAKSSMSRTLVKAKTPRAKLTKKVSKPPVKKSKSNLKAPAKKTSKLKPSAKTGVKTTVKTKQARLGVTNLARSEHQTRLRGLSPRLDSSKSLVKKILRPRIKMPKNRWKDGEREPIIYTCKKCKQQVELFLPAKVTCSRCGTMMQAVISGE
jgi:hypothetical protein